MKAKHGTIQLSLLEVTVFPTVFLGVGWGEVWENKTRL